MRSRHLAAATAAAGFVVAYVAADRAMKKPSQEVMALFEKLLTATVRAMGSRRFVSGAFVFDCPKDTAVRAIMMNMWQKCTWRIPGGFTHIMPGKRGHQAECTFDPPLRIGNVIKRVALIYPFGNYFYVKLESHPALSVGHVEGMLKPKTNKDTRRESAPAVQAELNANLKAFSDDETARLSSERYTLHDRKGNECFVPAEFSERVVRS